MKIRFYGACAEESLSKTAQSLVRLDSYPDQLGKLGNPDGFNTCDFHAGFYRIRTIRLRGRQNAAPAATLSGMLRIFAVLLTATGVALCAESADQGPLLVVQQLFDAMRTHDGTAVRSLFVPGAMLFSVRQDGTPDTTPFGQFADHVGSGKGVWLERIWNPKSLGA